MPEPLGALAPYLNVGLGGIVTAFIFAILFGWLVPRSTMDRIIQVHEEKAKDLKIANADKDETVRVLSQALDGNTTELTRLAQLLALAPPPEGRGR